MNTYKYNQVYTYLQYSIMQYKNFNIYFPILSGNIFQVPTTGDQLFEA